MDIISLLDIFHSACEFVLNKKENVKKKKWEKAAEARGEVLQTRPENSGLQISCSVRWADFDRKIFSPAFAVYWQARTPAGGNLSLNPSEFLSTVSEKLQVPEIWLENLIDCYVRQDSEQTLAYVNLSSYSIELENFYEVLVEEWTPDGISSWEVAEKLRESYPILDLDRSPNNFSVRNFFLKRIIGDLKEYQRHEI